MKWTLLPASGFSAHAAAWDALRATGPAAPVLDAGFVACLLDAFGSGAEVLALCEDGAGLLAATLLAPQGRARWATFQPAQAPVGPWLQRPGADTGALLADLVRALPGCALLVGLTQCDPFLLPRPADGGTGSGSDYIDTARISVSGDFDTWWDSRGKNLRSNLKKQRNRLAAAGTATRLEVWNEPGQMAQAVADYGRLESTGWKGRAGTAVAADNDQGRFYRHMLESFCDRGIGSVFRYYFNDELAAMDLCIEEEDCIVILKTAYDESIPKHYSPALLMREEACRRLFEEGRMHRIEFYGRVMEWHMRWTDEVRTMYHFNHYRWSTLRYLQSLRQREVRNSTQSAF
jgi:CelD/BcsL family acetyltransferase involved in cellulose biosynthesis